MKKRIVPRMLTVVVAAIAVAGCGGSERTVEIGETRTLDHARTDPAVAAGTKDRMGLPAGHEKFVHPPMSGAAAGAEAPATVGGFEAAPLAWTAPDGWKQLPAKQMRVVSFSPEADAGVECYVTVLGGQAGGVEANVNRWRQQLRLAPLDADAIAKLDVVPVLGADARFVEIDGGSVGLLGLVCERGAQTIFVKMTGPMESLRAQRDRFVAFCKSLRQS